MSIVPNQPALLRVLVGERVDPPPVWLMRQAGRYLPEYRTLRAKAGGFLRFCYSPELAAEATLQPVRRFDLDAAIVFSDILVVADGLGAKVDFREGEGPVVDWPGNERAIDEGRAALEGIVDRLAPVYETIRRVRRVLPREKALIGFAGAPWTVACYMIEGGNKNDFARTRRAMFTEPETLGRAIGLLVHATVEHLSAQISAGVDCVQLFESWAGLLPEPEFERWSIVPCRRIVELLRERHPEVPVIGFPRGAGTMLAEYAKTTRMNAVGLDSAASAESARRAAQFAGIQGHLDPHLLVAGGETMRRRIRHILDDFAAHRHVFNLGHGVLPETPPEHVGELVAEVRRWRRK